MLLFKSEASQTCRAISISARQEPKSALHFLYIFVACPRGALVHKFLSCRRFAHKESRSSIMGKPFITVFLFGCCCFVPAATPHIPRWTLRETLKAEIKLTDAEQSQFRTFAHFLWLWPATLQGFTLRFFGGLATCSQICGALACFNFSSAWK